MKVEKRIRCAELETGIKKLTSEIDKVEERINYFGNISKKLSDLYVDTMLIVFFCFKHA